RLLTSLSGSWSRKTSMPLAAALATNRRAKSPPTGRDPTRKRPRSASASGVVVRAFSARIRSQGLSTPRLTALSKQPPPDTSRYANPAPSSSSARRRRSAVGIRPASGSWLRTRIVVSTRRGTAQDLILQSDGGRKGAGAVRRVPPRVRVAGDRRGDGLPRLRQRLLGLDANRCLCSGAGKAGTCAAGRLRQAYAARPVRLRPLDIALLARIDLDLVADVHEQRHLNDGAGLERRRLRHVRD